MSRSSTSAALERRAAVFKALGEPTRLRIVDFLRERSTDTTGTEIAEHVGISLALLCHHTDALIECGLVVKRKEGQTSIWRINAGALAQAMRNLE